MNYSEEEEGSALVYCECSVFVVLPALHWDAALHYPALPAAHHCTLLPGLHSGKPEFLSLPFKISSGRVGVHHR